MKLVFLSDTHSQGWHIRVPDGDVLIHAGDHTYRGGRDELEDALEWLASLPHTHKLLVAGNHDWFFDRNAPPTFRDWQVRPRSATPQDLDARKAKLLAQFPTLTYLEDSGVTIDGVKFFGSPWQPNFWDWAFNFPAHDSGAAARETWAQIPDDTDVLITHGPPFGIRDRNRFDDGPWNQRAGCSELRKRVAELPHLKIHCFGHIHGGHGIEWADTRPQWSTLFVNASSCNESYEPINPPIVVNIEDSANPLHIVK